MTFKRNVKATALLTLLILLFCAVTVMAHPGRLAADQGHKDNIM